MRPAIIGGALVLALATACSPPNNPKFNKPNCQADINDEVIVQEFVDPFPCDMDPPQILNLEMVPSGNPQARCDHYGGRFIAAVSEGGEDICWNVDY